MWSRKVWGQVCLARLGATRTAAATYSTGAGTAGTQKSHIGCPIAKVVLQTRSSLSNDFREAVPVPTPVPVATANA